MPAPSVVVITRDHDTTADLVVGELSARGVGVARFDLANFPEQLVQSAYLVPARTRWTGRLRGHVRDVDLSAVRHVWWRKPAPISPHPDLTATEEKWAAAEARMGFGGLLAALPARWINRPDAAALAAQKPVQLRNAAVCGLRVPESLLTNDPEQARHFCANRREVIYKPLEGGPDSGEDGHRRALRARAVTADQITGGVARTTHLLQQRVECAYSVRCTIVGRRVFAARIDTPDDLDVLDWRECQDQLRYTPIDVPDDVMTGLLALMDTLGLAFSAPDFVVDHDGQWHFVGDLNPNGQWAWIPSFRSPITTALADELTRTDVA